VDDDADLAAAVSRALQNAGFVVAVAGSGADAIRAIEAAPPDLIVLDLNLPDMDGIELCRDLHSKVRIPVIMLTARTDEGERVRGLEVGADDYVTKPFSVKELVARVRAVLRRTHGVEAARSRSLLRCGNIELDLTGHVASVDGRPVDLTRTEFLILKTLMQNPGTVVSRSALAEAAWGTDIHDPHLLEVHMSNLRRKIEPDPRHPKHLITIRAVGYKIV
jgi:DNA-binding response OmpR family regulator